MPPRPLAVAVLAASALGLAACGDDPAPAGADAKAQNRQAELKFARCMRAQGIDFPDPGVGEQGGFTTTKVGGKGNTTPEKLNAASKACEKYRKAIRGRTPSPAQQQEFKRAALANARCMREHGIDMPDPQFGADGSATIKLRGGSGVKPDDPRFKAAQEACKGTMPMFQKQP